MAAGDDDDLDRVGTGRDERGRSTSDSPVGAAAGRGGGGRRFEPTVPVDRARMSEARS